MFAIWYTAFAWNEYRYVNFMLFSIQLLMTYLPINLASNNQRSEKIIYLAIFIL